MSKNDLWITAVIRQQEAATRLLGDQPDPLADQARKRQKELRKQFVASSSTSVDVDTLFASGKVSKKAEEVSSPPASTENTFLASRLLKSSDSDKKGKDKEKHKLLKKKKKLCREASDTLTDHLLDANNKTGPILAEVAKYATNIVYYNKELWLYDEELGCFHPGTYNEIARGVRSLLPYEEHLKLSTPAYKECFEQL